MSDPYPVSGSTPNTLELNDAAIRLLSYRIITAAGEWRKRQESNLPGALLRASLVLKTRYPTGDIALP